MRICFLVGWRYTIFLWEIGFLNAAQYLDSKYSSCRFCLVMAAIISSSQARVLGEDVTMFCT